MQNRCQDVEVNQHHNAALAVPRGGECSSLFVEDGERQTLSVPLRLKANEADEYFASTLSLDVSVRLCNEPSDFGCLTAGPRCGSDWCLYGEIRRCAKLWAGGLRVAVSEAQPRLWS